ncbi:MAG: 23S rRNA (adenine(2503)-C(2))-methyltransferase RlmN [Parachlamydiales bacterium]|nr:23S rRNA (adenine(2503)-C(2))-methyltransferase RlmN [Parachlamydiales bacterium]
MSFLNPEDQKIFKFFEENNIAKFRLKQIHDWIFSKYVKTFDEMTNLGLDLREKLKKNFHLYSLKLKTIQESKDEQTKKYLFELKDGSLIESVLILSETRKTLCISSQVGCIVKCTFCASGKNGFFRNLEVFEILEQIVLVSNDIQDRLTNIVFMGMGEPLLNLDNVLSSIDIMSSDKGFNISKRKISISTVGIVEGIEKLKEKNYQINLCLSLHAPDDSIRRQIIPYAKKYKLEDILKSLQDYFLVTKRDIAFEYILIENVNDDIDHAKKLYELIKNFQCSINLIPYNPIPNLNYKRPSHQRILAFKSFLEKMNLNVTQRYTKGDDISAACGQLAIKQNF